MSTAEKRKKGPTVLAENPSKKQKKQFDNLKFFLSPFIKTHDRAILEEMITKKGGKLKTKTVMEIVKEEIKKDLSLKDINEIMDWKYINEFFNEIIINPPNTQPYYEFVLKELPKNYHIVVPSEMLVLAFDFLIFALKEFPFKNLRSFFSLVFFNNSWKSKQNQFFKDRKHEVLIENRELQLSLWYILHCVELKGTIIGSEALLKSGKIEELVDKTVPSFSSITILADEKEENKQIIKKILKKNLCFLDSDGSFFEEASMFITTREYLEGKVLLFNNAVANPELFENLKNDPLFAKITMNGFQLFVVESKSESILSGPFTREDGGIEEIFPNIRKLSKNELFCNSTTSRNDQRNILGESEKNKEIEKILDLQKMIILDSKPAFGELPIDCFKEIVSFLSPNYLTKVFSLVNKSFYSLIQSDSIWQSIVEKVVMKKKYFRVPKPEMINSLNKEGLPWILFYRQYVQPLLLDEKMIIYYLKSKIATGILKCCPDLIDSWELNEELFQKLLRVGLMLVPKRLKSPKDHVLGDHKFGDFPDMPKKMIAGSKFKKIESKLNEGEFVQVIQLNCAKMWEKNFKFSHFIFEDDYLLGKDFLALDARQKDNWAEKLNNNKEKPEKEDYSTEEIERLKTKSFPKQGMMYFFLEDEDCEFYSYWYVPHEVAAGQDFKIEDFIEIPSKKRFKNPGENFTEFGKLHAIETFEALSFPCINYRSSEYLKRVLLWKNDKFRMISQLQIESVLDCILADTDLTDPVFGTYMHNLHKMSGYDTPLGDPIMGDFESDIQLIEVDWDDEIDVGFGDYGCVRCVKKKDAYFEPGLSKFIHKCG